MITWRLRMSSRICGATGPPGANLFLMHLAPELNDQDLVNLFSPFGNVVSAKVFIDKNTGLSKCFGFVSFDNPAVASHAMQAMDGYNLSGRRMKVTLKKASETQRPF